MIGPKFIDNNLSRFSKESTFFTIDYFLKTREVEFPKRNIITLCKNIMKTLYNNFDNYQLLINYVNENNILLLLDAFVLLINERYFKDKKKEMQLGSALFSTIKKYSSLKKLLIVNDSKVMDLFNNEFFIKLIGENLNSIRDKAGLLSSYYNDFGDLLFDLKFLYQLLKKEENFKTKYFITTYKSTIKELIDLVDKKKQSQFCQLNYKEAILSSYTHNTNTNNNNNSENIIKENFNGNIINELVLNTTSPGDLDMLVDKVINLGKKRPSSIEKKSLAFSSDSKVLRSSRIVTSFSSSCSSSDESSDNSINQVLFGGVSSNKSKRSKSNSNNSHKSHNSAGSNGSNLSNLSNLSGNSIGSLNSSHSINSKKTEDSNRSYSSMTTSFSKKMRRKSLSSSSTNFNNIDTNTTTTRSSKASNISFSAELDAIILEYNSMFNEDCSTSNNTSLSLKENSNSVNSNGNGNNRSGIKYSNMKLSRISSITNSPNSKINKKTNITRSLSKRILNSSNKKAITNRVRINTNTKSCPYKDLKKNNLNTIKEEIKINKKLSFSDSTDTSLKQEDNKDIKKVIKPIKSILRKVSRFDDDSKCKKKKAVVKTKHLVFGDEMGIFVFDCEFSPDTCNVDTYNIVFPEDIEKKYNIKEDSDDEEPLFLV